MEILVIAIAGYTVYSNSWGVKPTHKDIMECGLINMQHVFGKKHDFRKKHKLLQLQCGSFKRRVLAKIKLVVPSSESLSW